MTKLQVASKQPSIEVVTTTFVATGRPEGVHDFGRVLENLNSGAASRFIELRDASVRALYQPANAVRLDQPLLIESRHIVFATFEGPFLRRGATTDLTAEAPVLLLAPPFQIRGSASFAQAADPGQAIRSLVNGFFALRDARVYDAEGVQLGSGELIVVNAALVQMVSASAQHIVATAGRRPSRRHADPAGADADFASKVRRAA